MSLEWSHERESLMGVASGVANMSRESESRVESRNVGHETWVANVSREM